MTTIELHLHLEPTGAGEVAWWADSPDVAGFSAAAPTLAELRSRATAALREAVGRDVELVEQLAGAEEQHSPHGDKVRSVHAEPVPH